jgi:hypothetical protein
MTPRTPLPCRVGRNEECGLGFRSCTLATRWLRVMCMSIAQQGHSGQQEFQRSTRRCSMAAMLYWPSPKVAVAHRPHSKGAWNAQMLRQRVVHPSSTLADPSCSRVIQPAVRTTSRSAQPRGTPYHRPVRRRARAHWAAANRHETTAAALAHIVSCVLELW